MSMANDDREPTPPDAVAPAYYARHLDRISALERVRGYKRRTLELLAADTGQRVLDVGCGVGEEVRVLARLVGSSGQAVGVDASASLVAEARRRAEIEASTAEQADRAGDFFASGTLFIAAARKP
jgi:ubiquinone/menaquinone biosynthesis C-methylase UbiE